MLITFLMNYKQNKANRQFKSPIKFEMYDHFTWRESYHVHSLKAVQFRRLYMVRNTYLDVSKLLVKAMLCSGKGSTLGSTGVVICPLS